MKSLFVNISVVFTYKTILGSETLSLVLDSSLAESLKDYEFKNLNIDDDAE